MPVGSPRGSAGDGAPKGNKNAAKAKIWSAAIARALAMRSRKERHDMLEKIANVLIDECLKGESWAIKEFGDRMEGKAIQQVVGAGTNGEHVVSATINLTIEK